MTQTKTPSIVVTNSSLQTITLLHFTQRDNYCKTPLIASFHNDSVRFLSVLFNIKSITGNDSDSQLKHVTEIGMRLSDQHHLCQLYAWVADYGPYFYSDCVNDGGIQAYSSWTSIALVRAHWAHLRDLWETLLLPSILYSRLNLLSSGCLPRIRGKYCKGETSPLCFIQSVGRLAKKKNQQIQFITLFIIQNSA